MVPGRTGGHLVADMHGSPPPASTTKIIVLRANGSGASRRTAGRDLEVLHPAEDRAGRPPRLRRAVYELGADGAGPVRDVGERRRSSAGAAWTGGSSFAGGSARTGAGAPAGSQREPVQVTPRAGRCPSGPSASRWRNPSTSSGPSGPATSVCASAWARGGRACRRGRSRASRRPASFRPVPARTEEDISPRTW